MNYSKARQVDPTTDREDAGKWRYTEANNGRVYVTGGCIVMGPCGVCGGQGQNDFGPCSTCWGSGASVVGVCEGHDTADEAYAHHKQYMLDEQLQLDRKLTDQMLRCQVCKAFTDGVAYVGEWGMYVLCDEHRTRETIEELYTVGESWHS